MAGAGQTGRGVRRPTKNGPPPGVPPRPFPPPRKRTGGRRGLLEIHSHPSTVGRRVSAVLRTQVSTGPRLGEPGRVLHSLAPADERPALLPAVGKVAPRAAPETTRQQGIRSGVYECTQ